MTTSSPTASTSTMSTELAAAAGAGGDVKRRESLNLAPSPTLYNVSLAEAEADDDDEFDSQHQPIYAASSHNNIEFVDNETALTITATALNPSDERTYEALRNGSTSSTISSSISDSIRIAESSSQPSVLSVPQMAPPPPPPCSTLPSILKLVNNFENHVEASTVTTTPGNSTVCGVKLNPDEKVASDVREYWATIDFYNASKLAFNKRCKSVKAKRERIDQEYKLRLQQTPQSSSQSSISNSPAITVTTHHNSSEDQEPCMCVKCSIVYHETVIKGIASTSAPKPTCRTATLKADSTEQEAVIDSVAQPLTDSSPSPTNRMSINSDDHSTTTDSAMSTTTDKSESAESAMPTENTIVTNTASPPANTGEFAQLDEKLFNIKNELVNLSESSLDVFQLLLQLSDTMLDLNNQLSVKQNAARHLKKNRSDGGDSSTASSSTSVSNSYLQIFNDDEENQEAATIARSKIDQNKEDEETEKATDNDYDNVNGSGKKVAPVATSIETFLQKTIFGGSSGGNKSTDQTYQQPCTVSNIVNQINSTNSIKRDISNNHQTNNKTNLAYNCESSVTKFVDSLFNYSRVASSSASSSSSSSSSAGNSPSTANIYQSIDEEEDNHYNTVPSHYQPRNQQRPILTTNNTTAKILSRQQSLIYNSPSTTTLTHANSFLITRPVAGTDHQTLKKVVTTQCIAAPTTTNNTIKLAKSGYSMSSSSSTTSSNNSMLLHAEAYSDTNDRHSLVSNADSNASSASSFMESTTSRPMTATITSNGFNPRSNSVNVKSPPPPPLPAGMSAKQSASASLSYSQSISGASSMTQGARRPSFKFESNTILNKVQAMQSSSCRSVKSNNCVDVVNKREAIKEEGINSAPRSQQQYQSKAIMNLKSRILMQQHNKKTDLML